MTGSGTFLTSPLMGGFWRKSNEPKNLAKIDLWTYLLLRRFSVQLRRFVIDFG